MKVPGIKEVLAMNDAELGEFLGHPRQITELREDLKELDNLKGKERSEAEDIWVERISPRIDEYSVRWIKEDAIRAANPKKVLDSTEPSSVF